MMGTRTRWKGNGIRSPSMKRFLRKSWVSDTCGKPHKVSGTGSHDPWLRTEDGPPILSMTIAKKILKTKDDEAERPGHLWDLLTG